MDKTSYKVTFPKSFSRIPAAGITAKAWTAKNAVEDVVDLYYPTFYVKSYPYSNYGIKFIGYSKKMKTWNFNLEGFFSYAGIKVQRA